MSEVRVVERRRRRRRGWRLAVFVVAIGWVPWRVSSRVSGQESASAEQGVERKAKAIPDFEAKALSGQTMHRRDLVGTPTILIVNPSEEAGEEAKAWAYGIRDELGPDVRQRTIIAVDVPFFVTEFVAIGKAQSQVEKRYWNRTWLLRNTEFEESLGIPSKSADPHVFVLDARGRIAAHVQGELGADKMLRLQTAFDALDRSGSRRKPKDRDRLKFSRKG